MLDLTQGRAMNTGADCYISSIKGQDMAKYPNGGRINIIFYNDMINKLKNERYTVEIRDRRLYFKPADIGKGCKVYRNPTRNSLRMDFRFQDAVPYKRFVGLYSNVKLDKDLALYYVDLSDAVGFSESSHVYPDNKAAYKRVSSKPWAEEAAELGYDKPEVCRQVVEEAKEKATTLSRTPADPIDNDIHTLTRFEEREKELNNETPRYSGRYPWGKGEIKKAPEVKKVHEDRTDAASIIKSSLVTALDVAMESGDMESSKNIWDVLKKFI